MQHRDDRRLGSCVILRALPTEENIEGNSLNSSRTAFRRPNFPVSARDTSSNGSTAKSCYRPGRQMELPLASSPAMKATAKVARHSRAEWDRSMNTTGSYSVESRHCAGIEERLRPLPIVLWV